MHWGGKILWPWLSLSLSQSLLVCYVGKKRLPCITHVQPKEKFNVFLQNLWVTQTDSITTQKFDFLNLFIFRAFFWVFLRVLLFEQHPSRDRVKMIRFTSDFGKNSRISRLHSRARNALNFHKSNLAFRVNQQVFSFKPCLISSNILLLRSSNFRHFVLIYAHAFGFRAHCNDFTMLLNTVFSWIEEAAASIFFLSKKMRLLFEGGFYSRAASIKFEYLKGRNFREWPLGYCVLFRLPSLELFIYE